MAELIIVDSAQQILRFPVDREEFVIGRSGDCDITLDDPTISRYHAKVSIKYTIQDIGSTNGIWKEGRRFKQTTIVPGEEVFLGKNEQFQLRLETGGGLAPEVREPPAPAEEPLAEMERPAPSREALEGVENMADALRRSREVAGRLARAYRKLDEENDFLRGALYPDGNDPGGGGGKDAELEEVLETAERDEALEVEIPDRGGMVEGEPRFEETAAHRKDGDPSIPRAEPADSGSREATPREAHPIDGDSSAEGRFPRDGDFLRRLVNICVSESGKALASREGMDEDLLFMLGAIQKWGRDIERVTTRVAQDYAGVSGPVETMLPEVEHNITSLVNDLLTQGGSARRKKLEDYLLHLRTWYVACLGGYRKALERWCGEFLERLSPKAIMAKKPSNKVFKALGMDELFYWKVFEETMRNINVPTVMEEFEEHAAQAAMEIANRDRKAPLGKSSESAQF